MVNQQNHKSILILTVGGLIVFVLSIIFQNIYFGLIRGLIFLLAGCIIYFKPEFIFKYSIQYFHNGKIIVKRGFIKNVILSIPGAGIFLSKKDEHWLLGAKKVRVLIGAFPNLEKDIEGIES